MLYVKQHQSLAWTLGTVLIREVCLFQKQFCTHLYVAGTVGTVLTEVPCIPSETPYTVSLSVERKHSTDVVVGKQRGSGKTIMVCTAKGEVVTTTTGSRHPEKAQYFVCECVSRVISLGVFADLLMGCFVRHCGTFLPDCSPFLFVDATAVNTE